MSDVQDTIIRNLIAKEDFARAVTPHLKEEYFTNTKYKSLFNMYSEFFGEYNKIPTYESLYVMAERLEKISQDDYSDIVKSLQSYKETTEDVDSKWLVDETERFCQDRAIYLAVHKTIGIMNGEEKQLDKGMIPELLSKALGVSFDTSIGHSYFDDIEERFDFYHRVENRVPFSLQMFDRVTKGGLPNKTLTVYLAGTGGGKSLVMCHNAASALIDGKNVLYITLELAEERVAERIDANLLDIEVDDLKGINRPTFVSLLQNVKNKTPGKLIIKEYPAASAHVGHIRHLLRELKQKQKFEPNIIFVDYINLMTSSRMRAGMAGVNTYVLVKSIAEEVRGLATEFDVPIITATQANRDGIGASDLSLNNTSESIGLAATVDLMFGLISTEDLQKQGLLMVKQLKNRFSDITRDSTFVVGIDRAKMKLYDVANSNTNTYTGNSKQVEKEFFQEQDTALFPAKRKKFSDMEI
jgi:replicative DNA helicase